jgi:formate dehydrogenase subunit gamma
MHTLSRMMGRLLLAVAFALPVAAFAQTSEAPKAPAPQAQDIVKEQQKRSVTQPGNNSEVWREVRSGQSNYASIPGREASVLVQPAAKFPGQDAMTTAGEAWRKFRNGPITFFGGWILILVAATIAGIYFVLGPIKTHAPLTGRMIVRFTVVERWAHWIMGISFVCLGLSGLIILFGKHVLLPILGYTLFAWLTGFAKNLHNFVAPLFIVSLPIFILIYIRDNLPEKGDLKWMLNAWRMFLGQHMPSGKYNAGEKTWFWGGVVFLSLILCVTGAVLLFPNFEQLRQTMQQAHVIHAIAGVLVVAASCGHIYLGTVGVPGAYRNMRDGLTDETWAKEHHENWYNDVKSGKAPGDPAVKPAGAPQTQH